MPCLKKCKCGKNEKYFKLLNEDQIESFECDECPTDSKPSEQSEPSQPEQEQSEQPSTPPTPDADAPVETAAEKKARLKAEREAAKQAKAGENKAE